MGANADARQACVDCTSCQYSEPSDTQTISPAGRYESRFVLRLATTVFVTEAREVLQRLTGELPQ